MTVISIATIQREAEEAAESGATPAQACRYPFASPEGRLWKEFYEDADYLRAVAAYRSAIGESSCTS